MANWITIMRFPLLVVVVLLLYFGGATLRFVNVFLVLLLILMDTFDGVIARRLKQESLVGSVLDVVADRTVELVLWVCYADLGLISIIIPLAVIVRGTVVDAIRNLGVSSGQKPFSVMSTPWGRFLVQSPWMRSGYGITKGISFTGLALVHALSLSVLQGQIGAGTWQILWDVFRATSWIALAFCLVRGLPVLLEARSIFKEYAHGEETV